MSNGKKYESLREQMAYMRAENVEQTKKLDTLINNFSGHEKSSNTFRIQCSQNATSIRAIKHESLPLIRKAIYGLYALAGSAFLLMIASLVKYLLTKQ